MEEQKQRSRNGVSLPGLLTIAFIVLKLCGVIAWSWWWVLSPVWIMAIIVVIVVIITVIVAAIKD